MTETLYRSCPTCEASCGLVLEVDRASKQVISIKGDPEDERSKGYVCAKSQAFRYVYEDPERLRQPVKKVDDQWQTISWEQALSEVGEKLGKLREQHGKDSIAMYYGNPNGHNFSSMVYTELFTQMLNTERFFSAGSVDQQPKNLSCELLYGNAWVFPIPDIQRTDFFVCMGGNPLVSQGSLMSAPNAEAQLKGIRERGGQVWTIDPRRTETAAIADQHLFIKPGTDAYLLFAWVNVLFEDNKVSLGRLENIVDGVDTVRDLAKAFTPENTADITGVPAAQLRDLINAFNQAESPVLYGRIGLCTQEFGTLASWLVDVVNLLQGRLDAPGGAMFPQAATELPPPAEPVQSEVGHGRFKTRVRGFPEYMGMMPASLMAEELAYQGDDKARALITVAGNPVLSVPNGEAIREAMQGLELIVALDFYINETTSLADYILPSTSQLEHSNYDFLFQTTAVRNFARYSPQIFEPDSDARHQYEIMTELVARINGMAADDLHAMMVEGLAAQIASSPKFTGLDAEKIKTATSEHSGPERLLDMMLRAGPHGDGFEQGEGWNLQKIKAAEHGVDFGPLQPRLPDLLQTPDKRLNIAPALITDDVERLTAAMQTANSGFRLIGRRHIRDMNSWLHNINQYVRGKNRCTLLVHPDDAESLGLSEGGHAIVSGAGRSATVEVEISDSMMPGVVSLPHGFGHRFSDTGQSTAREKSPGVSCNDLIDWTVLDVPSGTSVVNGAKIEVRAA
ncbi:anaerobic selenocysteine-containing dehydrogenase [Litorivivens lipolytica]|uniref:Anaerobic selenocysteine-containing dehydrogenase n=1 Tax=Litorivivens lipolytica TaxID=1524264 RepID=A0A7W4W6A2_9GAMM|nr:molybdopterin-dependent oxidoreductase [Litorivivens lipolytica]MBB3047622.1 anaerobic selenocysteine-containing dehydrogenase [Litorivivens lipolytica]